MVWYSEFIIVLYISYMLHNPSSNALCMLYYLVEQELPTLPENLRSPQFSSGVRVTRSLVLCVCCVDRCFSFCTFSFGIVLSVLLRYTDYNCPFDIFKLFLSNK